MQNLLKIIILVGLTSTLTSAAVNQTRYNGYKVYHVIPNTQNQLKILQALEQTSNFEVEFWKESTYVGKAAHLMVAPYSQLHFIPGLKKQGFQISEFIPDVQRLIDNEAVNVKDDLFTFNAYQTYSTIQSFLADQAKLHPFARVVQIGKTFEGRNLSGIVIGSRNKPVIIVEAGIHAREWIAGTLATYLINELLNGKDPIVQKWIEDYEWHIIPIANPDGHEFSHTTTRMWRKTRSTSAGTTCRGADPNRNWGFEWATGGASNDPCSETYRGSSAFSEVETQALSKYVTKLASRLTFYLSLHSYSQLILLPFGVSNTLPEHDQWMGVGKRAATALAKRYGTKFKVGNIVDLLYVASGSSIDWVKGNYNNVKLALCYELRDSGNYGFILPADQIVPSGLEFIDSLKSIMVDLPNL